MKILAFAGSSSLHSINKQLVKFSLTQFEDADINLVDLNEFKLPLFSVDEEKNGFPEDAHRFLAAIQEADLIVCSLAEHNMTYSVAFKNVFDWCSRINVKLFQEKKMLLLSTSPGGFGGGNVMAQAKNSFPKFGANVLATFSLPKFYENFDSENGIINSALLDELNLAIKTVKEQF